MSEQMAAPRTTIIAEVGVNHNGSLAMARALIAMAAEAGADIVKFQTFRADLLVSKQAPKATYQQVTTGSEESQHAMISRLELGEEEHQLLIEQCRACGIRFLSTPFDVASLTMLVYRFDLPLIKIPSGEITNGPFLLEIARTGRPVILSTGMSTLNEIEAALSVLAFGYLGLGVPPGRRAFQEAYRSPQGRALLDRNVTLLHCTTEYPAPLQDVNLQAMDTIRERFSLPVGYSDHTAGITVPVAAVARGAVMIEKHVTLDRSLPGPDHRASLEPEELQQMVRSIREVEQALGSGCKEPAASELKNRDVARKSLVAAESVRAGECFTVDNVAIKRPGTGLSPMGYWELLGQVSRKDLQPDEVILP